jgi:hypothetical protein
MEIVLKFVIWILNLVLIIWSTYPLRLVKQLYGSGKCQYLRKRNAPLHERSTSGFDVLIGEGA